MKLWFYYTQLALLDLFRLWSATQHHVIIVAGICLPIMLLLGIKQGHLAELRRDLLTSPTGRQVVIFAAQQGELLNVQSIDRLPHELGHVDLIIPERQRPATISRVVNGRKLDNSITLYPTRHGDPLLAQFHADVLQPNDRGIVLASVIAERLELRRGDRATVTVGREIGDRRENASVELIVKALIPSTGDKEAIGYIESGLLDSCEQFVRGFGDEQLGWQAARRPVVDKYGSYLLFCERTSDLSKADYEILAEHGFRVKLIGNVRDYYLDHVLAKDKLDLLRIYQLTTESSQTDPRRRLAIPPSEITELTAADDVAVPWNEPRVVSAAAKRYRLIGFSLPTRTWLREYLRPKVVAFNYEAPTASIAVLDGGAPSPRISIDLKSHRLDLSVAGNSPASSKSQPTLETKAGERHQLPSAQPTSSNAALNAVVPVVLLAHFDAYQNHLALFDAQLNMFVPIRQPLIYDTARLYADTIDSVPAVVAALKERNYAVHSETARISEIHQQDNSLQMLVYVVGVGVFLFGIITVFSVLLDSTERKRSAIGIMRVMGVSRPGVFYLVIIRAMIIGLLAGIVSVLFGELIAWALATAPPAGSWWAWKPQVAVAIRPEDISAVFVGALCCALVGAFIPAWRASRLDPFDAIVEGRFR